MLPLRRLRLPPPGVHRRAAPASVGGRPSSWRLMRCSASRRVRLGRLQRTVARDERHHEVHREGREHERGGHDAVVLAAGHAREDDRQRDEPHAAHHARDLQARAELWLADAARARVHESGSGARQQPRAGADQIAGDRQVADEHERSRREHQAHVEVAQGDHVSLRSGGSPVALRPQAPPAARRASPGARPGGRRQCARRACACATSTGPTRRPDCSRRLRHCRSASARARSAKRGVSFAGSRRVVRRRSRSGAVDRHWRRSLACA